MGWLRAHQGGMALALMLAVLAGSFLAARNGGAATPGLLVAWGGDGEVPAVALLHGDAAAPGEPVVLLPGGAAAAQELRRALEARGCTAVAALFMPTGAPFPSGAERLADGFAVRRLVVARDPRSREDGAALRQRLLASGGSVEVLSPDAGRVWRGELPGGWRLHFQKGEGGRFRGEVAPSAGMAEIAFELLDTGETVFSRGGAVLLALPPTSRPGCQALGLPRGGEVKNDAARVKSREAGYIVCDFGGNGGGFCQ